MKNKTTAGLRALFLWWVWAHKFYLDQIGRWVTYLLLCRTFVPAFIAFIEMIILFSMDEDKFNKKYNTTQSEKNLEKEKKEAEWMKKREEEKKRDDAEKKLKKEADDKLLLEAKNSTDGRIRCPKCGSDQITANQKWYSAGKAVAWAVLTGWIGLLGWFIGSKKVKITCLRCGNVWNAGDK